MSIIVLGCDSMARHGKPRARRPLLSLALRSMTPNQSPWWESQLSAIRTELSAYLSRRLPTWRAEHDDLISDTLLSLTREIRNHPSAFPRSWFRAPSPQSVSEREYLHRFSMVVLQLSLIHI